jgi:hypothetical protein
MGLRNAQKQYVDPTWTAGVNDWVDGKAIEGCSRIAHFNFCDAQDPVGHRLNVARDTEHYAKVFDAGDPNERDVVFERYNHPGMAHLGYWTDSELFKRIVTEIVDGRQTPGAFTTKRFAVKPAAQVWQVLWTWLCIPVLALAVISALGLAVGHFRHKGAYLSAAACAAAGVLLAVKPRLLDYCSGGGALSLKPGILTHLMTLMVKWHQIERALRGATSRRQAEGRSRPGSTRTA